MKVGRASDVWSLGCILYQMVYGKTPFRRFAFNMPSSRRLPTRGTHASTPANTPLATPDALDCVRGCLNGNRRNGWRSRLYCVMRSGSSDLRR